MNNSVYSEHVIDWLYQLWIADQELDELLGEQWGPSGDDMYCEIPDVARDD